MTNLMNWLKMPDKSFKAFYYVVGEEVYLIDEIRKHFLNQVPLGGEENLDFNLDDLEGSKITGARLVTSGETLPLNVKKRLVFCREAQALKKEDWKVINLLLESEPYSAVIVFFFDKIDKRQKHLEVLIRRSERLSASVVREWERGPWIKYMAEAMGLSFSSAAQSFFEQLGGTNLLQLNSEIKKLKSYMGDKKSIIEEKDISFIVSRTKIDTVFELATAIGKKDKIRSLECLVYLSTHNQSEVAALALVARHIRILSRIHEGWKKRLSRGELIASANIPPFFFPEYSKQAKLWSENQIKKVMGVLYETEKALKSSPLASHIWLEHFVLQVC